MKKSVTAFLLLIVTYAQAQTPVKPTKPKLVVGIMVAGTIYMMRDISVTGFRTISILNIGVILGTWALLYFTRLPSPVIVLICFLLGWLMQ